MKISGFIWLADVVEKLERKHGVRQSEVREVFAHHPQFRFAEKGYYPGENVYVALGQTEAGWYLTIFFIYKKESQALIISARDMTQAERRQYERK